MRIGIFGGTFDPPHFGHLYAAEEARIKLNLDRVIFVPAAQSPHKEPGHSSPPLSRYRMLRLAVRNHPGFEVSDIELRRTPPSYTVDTVKELRVEFPFPHNLFFLAGADLLGKLSTWKDINVILELCRLVVMGRPGFSFAGTPQEALKLEIPGMDISAAEIRRKIQTGEDVDDFVPYKVLQLIEKEALYRR